MQAAPAYQTKKPPRLLREEILKTIRCVGPLLVALFVAACGGGGGEREVVAQQPQAVRVSSVSLLNSTGVNGIGNVVVVSHVDTSNAGSTTGFRQTLNIYRQDSANPDALTSLNSVYLGVDTLYQRLSDLAVTEQWITATMHFNRGAGGWISLVGLTPTISGATTFEFQDTVDRALAHGQWLLMATNTSVLLYDISVVSSPTLIRTFTLASAISSIAPLADGFFLMTQSGYGVLELSDTQNITFVEVPHDDIKASVKAYRAGNALYIAGPSRIAGKSKVARLDVSNPSSPVVTALNDQIDGGFIEFAHDGAGRYFLMTSDAIHLLTESAPSVVLRQTVATQTRYPQSASRLFAANGRFYTTDTGVSVYRMP